MTTASQPENATASLPEGHYSFEWSGGSFGVQLRAEGAFWCPDFQDAATWAFEPLTMTLAIEGGKYGEYVLRVAGKRGEGAQLLLTGGARGNESNWRKMRFVRPFTPQEQLLSGAAPFVQPISYEVSLSLSLRLASRLGMDDALRRG